MRNKLLLSLAAVSIATLAAVVAIVVVSARGDEAHAQQTGNNMQSRLDQVIRILQTDPGPEAVRTAIDDGMEILYGGMRPLPSLPSNDAEGRQILEQTQAAHKAIGDAELKLAGALGEYALRGKSQELKGRALDLKLFVEQMNEVAQALGQVTQQCGTEASLDRSPCDELRPLLDEATGHEISATTGQVITEARAAGAAQTAQIGFVRPSYSVKLRSPFVPPWFGAWEEDVQVTDPISPGDCVVVFKETKGLMLRLHFERVIVVTDPWVGTFGAARGTRIPIWRMEWVPSEYAKEWNICNANGKIEKTVTQRVKQDVPLNFFWRYYRKDP
jgi:hypothetical protein